MRLTFEVLMLVFGLYAAFYIINLNEEYAEMVAEANNPTGYCNVSFGSSKATMACNRISRLDDK
jgi:hypothetical protein